MRRSPLNARGGMTSRRGAEPQRRALHADGAP